MNFLETVGLIALIFIAAYANAVYRVEVDEDKRIEADINHRAMFVGYRLALRHLYQQHDDPSIREKIKKCAEYHYGGVSTLALDLDDSEYYQWIQADLRGGDVYRKAQSEIKENGYPLAVENGSIVFANRDTKKRVLLA